MGTTLIFLSIAAVRKLVKKILKIKNIFKIYANFRKRY